MANEVRLIDANALITAIQGTASEVAKNSPYDQEWFTRLAARQVEILYIIDEQPTVHAVEVVHGHWEYDPNGCDWGIGAYRCSHCGGRNGALPFNEDAYVYSYACSRYCPCCGAKMDGGVENA